MIRRTPSAIRSNYTVLPNAVLNDPRLSWEARGMLAYLLSKPDHWKVIVKALVKETKAKRDAVYRILNEIEDAGYITREQSHDETGQFVQVERIVHEVSTVPFDDITASGLAVNGSTVSGSTVNGKPVDIVSTELEKVLNEESTDVSNSSSAENSADGITTKTQPFAKEFQILWSQYPRKVGRTSAYKQVVARLRAGVSLETLLEATKNYAEARRGEDSKYTLHGQTFYGSSLRYEDYLSEGAGVAEAEQPRVSRQFSDIEKFLMNGDN